MLLFEKFGLLFVPTSGQNGLYFSLKNFHRQASSSSQRSSWTKMTWRAEPTAPRSPKRVYSAHRSSWCSSRWSTSRRRTGEFGRTDPCPFPEWTARAFTRQSTRGIARATKAASRPPSWWAGLAGTRPSWRHCRRLRRSSSRRSNRTPARGSSGTKYIRFGFQIFAPFS